MFSVCCGAHIMCVCCVSVVDSPVQLRTAPPALLGPALGAEPGQLWTGLRPAGSPCSLCSPSRTHETHKHTKRQQTNTPTYSYTHTGTHGSRNMWSAMTLGTGLSVSPSSCLSLSVSVFWSPSCCLCLPPVSLSSDGADHLPPPPVSLSLSL